MFDLVQPKQRKIKAFTTTQDSKTEIVRKLIHDIETMTIELPTIDLCPDLHREFSTYTYKMSTTGRLTFSHMPGSHDDYIDSLMLANFSRVAFMDRKPLRVMGHRNTAPYFRSPR
jgi:ABC-type multidrug transport system ATPase subunit